MFIGGQFSGFSTGSFFAHPDSEGNLTGGIEVRTLVLIGLIVVTMLVAYFLISAISNGDPYLYSIISLLFAIGMIMNYRLDKDQAYKHALLYAGGLFCFFLAYYIYGKISIWRNIPWVYFIVALGLFAATLIFGKTIYGSKNWIVIAGVSFQPAELIRISFVMLMAVFFKYEYDGKDRLAYPVGVTGNEIKDADNGTLLSNVFRNATKRELLLIVLVYIHIGFLILQRDWGFATIFFATFMLLYYTMGTKRSFMIINMVIAVVMACAGYAFLDHIKVRVDIWRDPFIDAYHRGYQILQSLYAIAWGGFTGTGIGMGNPELIPQVQHDFIFAAICEEMGTFGGIAVILLYFILVYRCIKVSLTVIDPFNKAVTLGIASLFAVQTFMMIGGVIKFIPMTGVTLPFISSGGSSMVTSFIALGIVQAVSSSTESMNHEGFMRRGGREIIAQYNKRTIRLLILYCVLFFSLVGYLTFYTGFTSKKPAYQAGGIRQQKVEDKILRGKIYDRNGKELAYSKMENGKQQRVYPYKELYAQLIGYSSGIYGRNRIEQRYNSYLASNYSFSGLVGIKDALMGEQKKGADLQLTVDHELQAKAASLMKGRNGAVVALDPRTGEVLAMVSNPTFDPNPEVFDKNWTTLVESDDSPLVGRATMGLYSPGSTFKTVIAAAAIEQGVSTDEKFLDEGATTINGRVFSNSGGKSYGEIDINEAFAVSSNVVFSELGVELGESVLRDISKRFGINGGAVPFDTEFTASRFNYDGKMALEDMASVGIGQGKLQITPLQMAMVAATVANNGVMLNPYIVKRAEVQVVNKEALAQLPPGTPSTIYLYQGKTDVLRTVVSSNVAAKVKEMMIDCVKTGTGKVAAIKNITVAAKTGTAQNELSEKQKNKEHAWFIAFAPAEKPEIAIAVLLEYNGESGGGACGPIAKDLIAQWLKK